MASSFRIHLSPPQRPTPQSAALPLDFTRRWLSAYEEAGACPPVPVFISQNAYIRAVLHAASGPDHEVGGILVGNWCADDATGQQFVIAAAALPARFTRQGSVYLTFTQDSLVDLHAKIDELFPGKKIVGWYHTHPHMGVFLSNYDTWLHNNFFPEPWQVALVIEPHSSSGGFFIRQPDGELDPSRYFGFYELDGLSGPSVVRWSNLQQKPEDAEKKGVVHDE